MNTEKLIQMSNQIASFFATQPGSGQADKVAGHLRDFWDPAMRAALKAQLAKDAHGAHPLVVEAAQKL